MRYFKSKYDTLFALEEKPYFTSRNNGIRIYKGATYYDPKCQMKGTCQLSDMFIKSSCVELSFAEFEREVLFKRSTSYQEMMRKEEHVRSLP